MNGESKISEARKRLAEREGRFNPSERKLIERAFRFAKQSHATQKRKTGEPYVCHSLEVATTLCDWKMDASTITAALLHDVPEDTSVEIETIAKEFGAEVSELVEAVTKLSAVRLPQSEIPLETENLRHLFLAMAKDLRVVLLKLADRLHNIRTIVGMEPEKRRRFALETIEIYAPLADGLGMGEVRAELADSGFRYAYPVEFQETQRRVEAAIKRGQRYLAQVKRQFESVLADEGIKAEIDARTKTLYSLFRKLQEKQRDLDKVYDLFAVRIVVGSVEDCYRGMGVIHRTWQPLPHRIKDYIAVPKANGYRSLHTTIFGPQNRLLEVQFRTPQMHDEAEHGVAAHAVYSEGRKSRRASEEQSAMMKRLKSWQEEVAESADLVQRFKLDLFTDRIFVFTPKGAVHSLPAGSSPVDLAYAVHTEVGNSCRGAKVNGAIVPLDAKLTNGDVVEIIRGSGEPNRAWLKSVRTGHARSSLRRFFRQHDRSSMVSAGRRQLNAILKRRQPSGKLDKAGWKKLASAIPGAKENDDVLAALGEHRITEAVVTRALGLSRPPVTRGTRRRPAGTSPSVVVDREQGLPTELARCCNPQSGQAIVGYITLQKRVSIHRENCPQVRSGRPDRLVSARWAAVASDRGHP